jgi:hypothetical protein
MSVVTNEAPASEAPTPDGGVRAPVGAQALERGRALRVRILERPLTSLAVAVGVGFLVGGALSFRAGRFALVAAARRVAQEVLKQVI